MLFIGNKKFYGTLKYADRISFYDENYITGAWQEIKKRLQKGEDMIFMSAKNIDCLKELWIFATDGAISKNAVIEPLAPGFKPVRFTAGNAKYLYVRPAGTYAVHGIDEEPRMDIFPLIIDRDGYGTQKGAVGLMLKNYDSSHAGGNYKGGCWYIIAAENASEIAAVGQWDSFCKKALEYKKDKCYISRLTPEYPLYRKKERVRIDWRVENTGDVLTAATLVIEAYNKSGRRVADIAAIELALNVRDCNIGYCDWYPAANLDGVYSIKATLNIHDKYIYGLRREQTFYYADSVSSSVLFVAKKRNRPVVEVDGRYLIIDGRKDFFIGTHYYPSSTFFELSYRPVRLECAAPTIAAMKNAGVKICRLWCDPVMDELSLRGMEALIEIFAENGIVADIMFFSSWVHFMEVNTAKRKARFEAADMKDECLIGLLIKNMPEQQLYVAEMAERWRDFTNIIWDFSNESSVVNPAPDQLEVDWLDDSYKELNPPYQSINIYSRWGAKIKEAIRAQGAMQPVIYGVHCWNTGSENYRSTKDGDIIVDHTYYGKGMSEYLVNYQNTRSINKPFMVEEFGGVWFDNTERAAEYNFRYHAFFASGHSAAMNYEWGISWLCDKLSGTVPYMKFKDDTPAEDIDTFVLSGRYTYGKSWPNGSIGVCPWIASPEYGVIYSCMNYESPTMFVMKRFSRLGKGLAYCPREKNTVLVLPFEFNDYVHHIGYNRKFGRINECLKAMWDNGVYFDIWQSDALDTLPKTVKVVIYPNFDDIDKDIQRGLDNAAKNGAKIYYGGDMDWLEDINIEKIAFAPVENSRLMIRGIEDGEAVVVFNDAPDIREYTVDNITIGVKKYAIIVKQNDMLRIAEFSGKLSWHSKDIAWSTMCVLIMTEKGKSLADTDMLTVYPYEAGEITFAAKYGKCDICADDGHIIDTLHIDKSGSFTVTADMSRYTLVIA